MEQLAEFTKVLHASLPLQQQQQQQLEKQLLQQQEKCDRSQIFEDELMQLRKQQAENSKLLCETVISKTEERGYRFSSPEGISNSLSEYKYDSDNGVTFPAYFRRYETTFSKRYEQWSEVKKIYVVSPKMKYRGEH